MARFQGFSDGDPDWLAVRYLGTTSAKPPYKFLNVWIDNKDGKAILRTTRPPPGGGISSDVSEWTRVDPAAHVLNIKPMLTKSGALTAATLKALGKWKPHIVR